MTCRSKSVEKQVPAPFSNGTQYWEWIEKNCYACKKCPEGTLRGEAKSLCDIELAINDSLGSGTLPIDMFRRMGATRAEAENQWCWQCPEFIAKDGDDDDGSDLPKPPDPNQTDMFDELRVAEIEKTLVVGETEEVI